MSRLFADILEENQEPKGQRLFKNIVNETEPQNIEKEVETTKQPTRLFADIVEPTKTLSGGVKKNVRDYSTRFEDRPNKFAYNLKEFQEDTDKTPLDYAKVGLSAMTDIPGGFVANFCKDVKDTVTGLAQITGNVLYNAPVVGVRNLMRVAKGDIQNVGDYLNYIGQDTKEEVDKLKQTPEFLNNVKEGLKEAYGQKGIDIISDKGINLDVPGLVQSYYAHPLNLLDIVGAGEVGKLGTVAKTSKIKPIAKAGETVSEALQKGNYSKQVGNKVLKPQYSENLVITAVQRLAESEPIQSVIKTIDESGLRPSTDVVADFLGLSPESRLRGEKGATVRQTKLLEQKNQVKNIAERNEAIAKNKELVSGLNEAESKKLVQSIESGGGKAYENLPKETTIKTPVSKKQLKETIKSLEFEKGNLNNYRTVNRYKNKFHSSITDILGHDLENANRRFNKDVLGDIQKNVNKIGDNDYYSSLENKTREIVEHLPDEAQLEYYEKLASAMYNTPVEEVKTVKNNIPDVSMTPEEIEKIKPIREALQEKVNQNAEFYTKNNLLKAETVEELPVNTYASIKYNKPITELSEAEKLDG